MFWVIKNFQVFKQLLKKILTLRSFFLEKYEKLYFNYMWDVYLAIVCVIKFDATDVL